MLTKATHWTRTRSSRRKRRSDVSGKAKELDLDILERTLRIDNGRLGIPVYFSVCGKDALKS